MIISAAELRSDARTLETRRAAKIRESKVPDSSGKVGVERQEAARIANEGQGAISSQAHRRRSDIRVAVGGGREASEREQTARQTYNFGDKI